MIIKDISIQNKNNYFIRNTQKEYNESKTAKLFFKTFEEYNKHIIDYYETNKKANYLDYNILER